MYNNKKVLHFSLLIICFASLQSWAQSYQNRINDLTSLLGVNNIVHSTYTSQHDVYFVNTPFTINIIDSPQPRLLEVKSNEVVIISSNLKISDSKFRIKVDEGGMLIVLKSLTMDNGTLLPVYGGHTTNTFYPIENKGLILVGDNYKDQSRPNAETHQLPVEQSGVLIVGKFFQNGNGVIRGGTWATSLINNNGQNQTEMFFTSASTTEYFAVSAANTQTQRKQLELAFQILDHNLPRPSTPYLRLQDIRDQVTNGIANVGSTSYEDVIKTLHAYHFNPNVVAQQNPNSLRTDQIVEVPNDITFNKPVTIERGKILVIDGKLTLTDAAEINIKGTLIVNGDIAIETHRPEGIIFNENNLVIGGSLYGYSDVKLHPKQFVNMNLGTTIVQGNVYEFKSPSDWTRVPMMQSPKISALVDHHISPADDGPMFPFNVKFGLPYSFSKMNQISMILEDYLNNPYERPNKSILADNLKLINDGIVGVIGMGNAHLTRSYDAVHRTITVRMTVPKTVNMMGGMLLFRRRQHDPNRMYDIVGKMVSRPPLPTSPAYSLSFEFVDKLSSDDRRDEAYDYVVVGNNPLNPFNAPLIAVDSQGEIPFTTTYNNPMFISGNSGWAGRDVSLPITLSKFTAGLKDNNVILKWTDEQEINTSHFVIERSLDGQHFEAISEKIKASGNSETELSYSFEDTDLPNSSSLFYRLVEYDLDGQTQSWVRKIHLKEKDNISMYPNPVHNVLHLNATKDISDYEVVLVNLETGEKQDLNLTDDYQGLSIHLENIQTGLYVIELFDHQLMVYNQKLMIE
ncbi:T9SS type A sorting domain-containing protein [Flammeovirga sp. MY04]|uniref:T9SS type A sorting domain-containing protein n=1 Tax=Flammeovirga sp. MY04 TaxID=1191459 RepID=UPI000827171D|nr:T9SS type A sorting domain-containing protein [Flammeovirga sp. MY04]ANQ52347.2 T9SS type A sorting domain-containing protein [Flammeovirga sp. MY04]